MECAVRACRACLATDSRLLSLDEGPLLHCYRALTGDLPHDLDWMPRQLCYECAARARRCLEFGERCRRGRDTLQMLLLTHPELTQESVRAVDRLAAGLASPLQRRACAPPVDALFMPVKLEDREDVFCHPKVDAGVDLDVKEVQSTGYSAYHDETGLQRDEWDAIDSYAPSPAPSVKSDHRSDDEPLAGRLRPDTTAKKERSKRKKHRLERQRKGKRRAKREVAEPEVEKKSRGRKKFDEEFATVLILTHEEQVEELRKRRNSLNYTNSPHKCDKCYKGFVDDAAYTNHMARHEPESGEHACAVCLVRCRSPRKLKSHVVAAHARKYACRACDHVSNTSNQAREHDKWHKGYTYECKMCGENFRKSTTLLTHARLRHRTEFVCGVCGGAFVGRHGLAVHKKRAHGGAQEASGGSVYCAECDVSFSSEEAWKRHKVTSARHGAGGDFENGCRVCGEVLETRAELVAHGGAHPRAPRAVDVKCDQCDSTFTSARKCLAHFKRMHLGMKYPIKKNVVCEVCGKKCTSNATLAYHQRTHTGEKPFQCPECPKRFSIRQRLQIHERTHTGERPYPCNLCRKAFRHKPALNRHLRVHTGAKPYECNYCGKTFSQSNSMKLHVHTVHLKLPPPYRGKGGRKAPLAVVPLAAQRL